MSHVNSDPNMLKECPFDKSHKIAASRFQNHLIKCRKSHPDKDKLLETCPYNATHRYSPDEKIQHLLECPDGKAATRNLRESRRVESQQLSNSNAVSATPRSIPVNMNLNNDDEDWDDAIEEPKCSVLISKNEIHVIDDVKPLQPITGPNSLHSDKHSVSNRKSERRKSIEEEDLDNSQQKRSKLIAMGRGSWKR